MDALKDNGVRLRFIGDRSAFKTELQNSMSRAEELTRDNSALLLNVAVNYGGRWDITEAARALAHSVRNGSINPEDITESLLDSVMATRHCQDPDLFIRTGNEMRISNFLLWQSAYSEFYFSPALWPDFDATELDQAIAAFQSRERRFGLTGKQVKGAMGA